ncbi:hypothetical protein BHM03_00005507 [Ensete ventricosum]|nr:hypothetical protein BHM03_00005507 [Ensete ventricosum]
MLLVLACHNSVIVFLLVDWKFHILVATGVGIKYWHILMICRLIFFAQDIAAKIMSFSQQGPRAVCILSANGAVSTVTLRQSATSGGTVTYEVRNFSLISFGHGRFEILCLSGSYTLTDSGGSRSRAGGLSISLSSPDGRVIGGGVAGSLIAANPVQLNSSLNVLCVLLFLLQVIVGSFIYAGSKVKSKVKASNETGTESELEATRYGGVAYAEFPSENLTPPVMAGWPASRQLDMRNAHMDIDLTRG